MYIFSNKIMIN